MLHLTDEEATCLLDIFYRVGGNPDTSRRGIADGMSSALHKAGVQRLNKGTSEGDIYQGLRFSDRTED
jgi:hypothetical protein